MLQEQLYVALRINLRRNFKLNANLLPLHSSERIFEVRRQLFAGANGHFLANEELSLLIVQRYNVRRCQQVGFCVRCNGVDDGAKNSIFADIKRKTTETAGGAQY